MILNSKGKLFGKVSIVDLIIILVIIVAVVAALLRFDIFGENSVLNKNAESTEVYYTFVVNGIREDNKDWLLKGDGTEFFLTDKPDIPMGTLQHASATEAEKNITLADGTVKKVAVPERYDVTLTLKINAVEKDNGYYNRKLDRIGAGKEYSINNIYSSVFGKIDKVWVE